MLISILIKFPNRKFKHKPSLLFAVGVFVKKGRYKCSKTQCVFNKTVNEDGQRLGKLLKTLPAWFNPLLQAKKNQYKYFFWISSLITVRYLCLFIFIHFLCTYSVVNYLITRGPWSISPSETQFQSINTFAQFCNDYTITLIERKIFI